MAREFSYTDAGTNIFIAQGLVLASKMQYRLSDLVLEKGRTTATCTVATLGPVVLRHTSTQPSTSELIG